MTILLTVISIVFQSIYIIDRLLTVLLYCNIIIEGSIYEVPYNNNIPHIVEGKDLEPLTVASMQTLSATIKNVVKKKFHLVQESVESMVTKKIFEERLDVLVERISRYQNQIKILIAKKVFIKL